MSIELFNQFIAIITLPIIVSSLNLYEYGIYTFSLFLSYLIYSVTNWGMTTHLIKVLSDHNIDYSSIAKHLFLILVTCSLGLLFFMLIIISFLNFQESFFIFNEIKYFLLITFFGFLLIFNPLQLMHSLNLLKKVWPIFLFSRFIFFIFLILINDLNLERLITLNILTLLFPFIYSFFYFNKKFSFLFLFGYLTIRGMREIFTNSLRSVTIFIINSHFLLFISFILSFKLSLKELATFNFLIQIFRPGILLVEIIIRSTWQYSLGLKHKINIELGVILCLCLLFFLTSVYGFHIYDSFFKNSDFLRLWPEVKLLIYLLCFEVFYFYLAYIAVYKKSYDLVISEKIILKSMILYPITVLVYIFYSFSIIEIFYTYFINKVFQMLILYSLFKFHEK